MIRINQLKMPLGHDRAGLLEKAARVLRVPSEEIEKLTIVKQSVDARKKPDIWYSYVVDIGIRQAGQQKDENEQEIEVLFQSFCRSLSILERQNQPLQQQLVPLKYRMHMTEFQKK